ncbi:DUF3558 domain-containing protein [Amycolatopsis sp. EV170708-02-1]|uniref:DUF3558 domain-containing protein n=1 Tax=Amycolatopsis sp. EV170708-02-1 TaxID=2919322 RepID=UPI001F0B93EF|nr:DUF3558 domain-containing protein [Amycolatopsis sp. EV170708-02-1]UMP02452.1 DUF3558 domain-containing protein [Amycolatopsis sp. EV170708-02-1]
MPLRPHRGSRIAPIAVLAIAASACSSELQGDALPQAPTIRASTQPTDVFKDLSACGLLEPTTAVKGFEPPKVETYESDNGCGTAKRGYASVSIYLVPEAGIDQLSPGQGTKVPSNLNGRDAVEIPGDAGTDACTVAVAVGPNARMTASTTLERNGTNEEACALSREIAEAAEPKLPRSN